MTQYSILFVCLGNICRSPAAEAVMKYKIAKQPDVIGKFHIESCAIGNWHIGSLPDPRMIHAAAMRDIPMTSRAQQFQPFHFDSFDLILAADRSVLKSLQAQARSEQDLNKVFLMTNFSSCFKEEDVPDPYFGEADGFEYVLDMLEDISTYLIENIGRKKFTLS